MGVTVSLDPRIWDLPPCYTSYQGWLCFTEPVWLSNLC